MALPVHRLKLGFKSSELARMSQSLKLDLCVPVRLAEGSKTSPEVENIFTGLKLFLQIFYNVQHTTKDNQECRTPVNRNEKTSANSCFLPNMMRMLSVS